nr:hypothetical protein [Tanacetum cinerariifolium]
VLRYEKKIKFVEQSTGPAPDPETGDPNTIDKYYETVNLEQEVACLMLSKQAKHELFKTVKAFYACKQEEGYAMPNELCVSLILNSLNKDYDQFIQNYNMYSMGKTIAELHAMLKLHDKGAKGKDKGKDKGKNKLAYALKPKIPPSPKRENLAKDSVCHHCKEVGHWRRNCPYYQAELKKRKNASGLRESKKLKHGALSLYMGNGMRAAIEAIGSFDLILPSGLIIVLYNFHFAPSIHRGVVSISHFVNNGYIHTFMNNGISVSKDNVFYFNAIPRDGIYEIDMHNLYPNGYALESATRILNMVPSKKNKIFIARNDEFFENSLMVQEASESHGLLESSESDRGLKLIQEEDTQHSENTSKIHNEVAPIEVDPQNVEVPICRSARKPQAPDRYGFYVDMENSKNGYTPMIEKHDYRKSQGAKTPYEVQHKKRVPYASAIGSIMYAVRCTRPDVAFAQNLYSHFQQNPSKIHWTVVKVILNFQTDKEDTKSQTGYVFVLNGGAVDLKSAKQSTTAMSSTEAEYVAAAEASMEAVWIRKFIDGLGSVAPSNKRPMKMLCGTELAIAMANDPGILKGATHFQRKYHYICEVIQEHEIVLKKVHTDDNVVDPFTKPMPFDKHYEHAMAIGIVPTRSLM